MDPAAIFERAERIAAVRTDGAAGRDTIESGLVAVREVQAWCDAQHAGLVSQLADVDSFPEQTIAAASKTSVGRATRAKDRADTLNETPTLAAALDDGAVTAGHVDAVTRAGKQLDADQRAQLLERVERLVDVAAAGTVEQFDRRVKLEATRVQSGDGMDRLERQRRATRLRHWVGADGMWNLSGTFDPVTGVELAAQLDRAVETLFAEATPDLAPSDPIEKQRFLTAHALGRLVQGNATGAAPGRGEFLVVIDAGTPTPTSAETADAADAESGGLSPSQVSWPIPVEIPTRVLADLAGSGDHDVTGVVVCNGVVLHAPGATDQGRASRIANRAQRRALRAMYDSCGIPGCTVAFDRCQIHHIIWWRNGGRTDLANLIPVCTRHHGRIHHDRWVITLGPHRELTLTLPDGTVRNTGPPTIRAA